MNPNTAGLIPKITKLRVGNYKSLGDPTELILGDLTVLVGSNGSGKSNICDAFRFLADVLKMGLEASLATRGGIESIRRWSPGRPFNLWFEVLVQFLKDDTEFSVGADEDFWGTYRFQIAGSGTSDYRIKHESAQMRLPGQSRPEGFLVADGSWMDGPEGLRPQIAPLSLALPLIAGDERFSLLADALRNISIYNIFPEALRRFQKPDHLQHMNEDGSNWGSVLKNINMGARSAELITALGQLTGDIDSITVKHSRGYLFPEFRHKSTTQANQTSQNRLRWSDAAQESDGTLRMAGILAALLQEPSPTLLGIEEPESTIHPGAIPLLYDYIKEASERGQVILTTHSPDLLALLDADEVRVVERHEGVTTVAMMDEAQRQAVHNRLFNPGELLRMEGLKQQSSAAHLPLEA